MPDEPIKKRMTRAKQRAALDLSSTGYFIVPSNNSPVCLMALSETDIRIIRICVDSIRPGDRSALARVPTFPGARREIWLRKPGQERLEIHKL